MNLWVTRPLDRRAARGGELGVNDRFYRGGEIMPFYVPRVEMPQINEEDYPEFFAFCADWHITISREVVAPLQLRPHQQIDKFKAAHMTPEVAAKPILVSQDYFVLDGNHRRMAHLLEGTDISILVLSLSFEAAIQFLFRFPKTYTVSKAYE